MNLKLAVALLLIVLGIVAMTYQGITRTSTPSFALPLILGAFSLVGGLVMLVFERNQYAAPPVRWWGHDTKKK